MLDNNPFYNLASDICTLKVNPSNAEATFVHTQGCKDFLKNN